MSFKNYRRWCRYCNELFNAQKRYARVCPLCLKKNHQKKIEKTLGRTIERIKARDKRKELNQYKRRVDRFNKFIKMPQNQLCQLCWQNKAKVKHHPDYDRPLDVLFICLKCHRKEHSANDMILKVENQIMKKGLSVK